MTRVGFVGLGNIGKPMALRLTDLDLRVYDVASEPVAELVGAGATEATSVAEVADVDVLCVMVRDDDQVRSVAGEVLASGVSPVVVVHSTVAPTTPQELEALGLRVLDAPVSGGPMGAADGSLAIMVGGDPAAYDLARPVLERLGQPEDMVGACLFLLSEESSWMTGQIIAVDGGQTFRS